MPVRVLTLFAALSLAIASPSAKAGSVSTELVQSQGPVQVGQALPTFAGYDLAGAVLRWRDFIKEPPQPQDAIVISVFASWCAPCVAGLKSLRDVAREDPNLRLLLVNYQETEQVAQEFLSGIELTVPTLVDQYGTVCKRLGVTNELPRSFLVDGSGVVHAIFKIEGGDFEAVLKEEIEKMRLANGFSGARIRGQEIIDDLDATVNRPR
jgi:thiol-disulfide isomerase/thioredoxin